MISKEKNDNATDLAWNQLHSRLKQDGLLQEKDINRQRAGYFSTLKWVAGIAILCICFVSIWLILSKEPTDYNMVTIYNEKNSPILVTTLQDGSVAYLTEESTINYPDHFNEKKREVILEGDAFFEISKKDKQPFFVDTKPAIIQVLGTAFNVKSMDSSSFMLSVRNGEVKVTLKKSAQILHVKTGETVLLSAGELKMVETDSELFNTYTKYIHFKDERLADVIRIINMNSKSTQLKISPKLENRPLTVSFSNNTPQRMAELICLALNLNYTEHENLITISE